MSSNKHKSAINLMGFVPALVVQYHAQNEQIKELPAKQQFKSVVMFTDISGFTNLTEALSKLGNEGPELTAFVINRYMELLVKAISKSGGDILKFAGDAMIVVWPPSVNTDVVQVHEDLRTVCRMALQNALDIQNKLNDTCMLHNISLSVKIGFGVGDINIIYVGGVFGRSEYLATGPPLTQAFQSEHCATKGGQTIVSQEIFAMVKDFFEFKEVPNHQGFYLVEKQHSQFKVKMKAEALLIKNSISVAQFEKIKPQILTYVPAALKPYIEIGQEKWASELRRVTTLFISLGIDLSDAKTDSGLQRIQNVIKTVQRCVYIYEGSLNKLLMDDKGSTLIVVFGLPPACHQNDAVRGIQTAFLLDQELRKIKCKVAIGISTGTAFCGVIGTSGSRREYSVLGDCVNLSARLMQMATQPLSPPILIDEPTAQDAQQKIQSIFWNEKRVKGKAQPVLIYEPLQNFDDFRKIKDIRTHYQQKVNRSKLKSHEEPEEDSDSLGKSSFKTFAKQALKKMSVFNSQEGKAVQQNKLQSLPTTYKEKQEDYRLDYTNKMIGVDDKVTEVQRFLQKYLDGFKYLKLVKSRLCLIYGEYGIGKSFLIRNVLDRLQQVNRDRYMKGDLLEILISQLNPASRTKPLNAARIFLRNIFLSLAQKYSKPPNQELIQSICQVDGQVNNILSDVLSLGINEIQLPSIREDVQMAKIIKPFVTCMMTHFLNQEPQVKKLSTENELHKRSMDLYEQSLALLVICDDFQDADDGSIMIFKHIIKYFQNIAFVALVRDQHKEISAFAPPTFNAYSYREGIAKLQKLDVVQVKITLQGIKSLEHIQELLLTYFGFNSFMRKEDAQKKLVASQNMFSRKRTDTNIHDITEMIELLNKVRDPLMFWESKPELEQMDFNMLCFNYIYVITRGHPLYIINIINNLINADFISVNQSSSVALVSEKFLRIIGHEEWLEIECPLAARQLNAPLIDKLTALQQLILKQACVIGDIFDVQTLNFVSPFKEWINQKVLLQELGSLYEANIIEIMNVENDNIYYRFTNRFFREVLYSRMTYAHRRQTHKNVALALQKIPQPLDYHNKKEYKRMEFHWALSSNRSVFSPELEETLPQLTPQEKRLLIIKKIKQLLDRNLYARSVLLNQGYILKKSEKGLQWNWRYCVISSESLIVSQEDNNPEHILTVPLKCILQIITNYNETTNQRYYQIFIETSSYIRGDQVFDFNTKLYFAVETEDELNEWATYLEFARAYAVYVDFANNFGRIPFPLSSIEYDYQLRAELALESKKPEKIGALEKQSSDRLLSKHSKNVGNRPTLLNMKKFQTRKSSMFADGFRGSTSSSQAGNSSLMMAQQQQQDVAQLKEKLKQFLLKSQQSLISHIICRVVYRNGLRLGSINQIQAQYLIGDDQL